MTDTTRADLRAQLNSAKGHVIALESYARSHPGLVPPLLAGWRAEVRNLTAALAAAPIIEPKDNMPNMDLPRQYLADINAELRALHAAAGNKPLNATQQARWDELTADAEEVEGNLRAHEAEAARLAKINAEKAKWGGATVSDRGYYSGGTRDLTPADVARLDPAGARDAALALLDRSADHLADDVRAGVEKLIRSESTPSLDVAQLNKMHALTNSDAYRSAFRKLTAAQLSNIVTLSESEADAVRSVQRASMAEGTGSTGGFAVPSFLDPTIALNAQGSANPLRRLARNETVTTNKWKGVSTGGVTWSFVGEGQASTDASPTVGQPTVDVHTARCWLTYSLELQQDAVDLDRQLFEILAAGWDDTLAGALATGSGVGEPRGLITALDAITTSEVQITAAGSLTPADLSKVWVALPDRARGNASWVMSESVREAIASWGDEYGNRTVDLGGTLTSLRNRPVYSTEKFPAIATTTGSANQLVVGDVSGYLIAQRAGMTVEPVQTVVDGNGVPVGKRGLFAWARIGADVIDAGKLRLLQQ